MAPGEQLPKVLISNDDGVAAPGLRELVYALHESSCCEVYVCGPAGGKPEIPNPSALPCASIVFSAD